MKRLHFISICLAAFLLLFSSGCKDNESEIVEPAVDETNPSGQQILDKYKGLSSETRLQLTRAMSATGRYHSIKNAIKADYEDANIFVPHMGYHYLKTEILDDKFDRAEPELLVYSTNPHNGKLRLVALEYAVPIDLSPGGPPEGFAGNDDIWNKDLTYDLWTLHAWIWKYNPDGVFNAMNPRIP